MKKNLKTVTAILIASAIYSTYVTPVLAQGSYDYGQPKYTPNQNYVPANYNLPTLQGKVVTIPAHTTIPATVQTDINSGYITVGDSVSVSLASNFYNNGSVVFPAGSIIHGNAVIAERAGMTGKHGKLKIHFTSVTTPNGQRYPMSGKLATQDGTGLLVGGTNTQRTVHVVKEAAKGSAIGAIFGTIIGAITGKTGKGAWAGTAVGGGVAATKSLVDKGNEAILPSGSTVEIMLDQPLTVSAGLYPGY